ncbi:MAG: alpha-glucan family phosphorylase [Deferribacteraceae bacterium]|jgi:starch phosphorylase|nr:alpha-glucan family phosphorylase [Deferribacteraceae bacterium]
MNLIEIPVKIKLPEKLSHLLDIAYNLMWCWSTDALELFESINPTVWTESKHNPIEVLSSLNDATCKKLMNDTLFMSSLANVYRMQKEYMERPRWFGSKFPKEKDFLVGYFSLEYGLHESLPLYAGGLGILSGDHCKSASDVGLPFVAVGLLYRCGYFHQYTNSDGWQQESYGYNQFYSMPIKPVYNDKGEEVIVELPMCDRLLKIKVWKLTIGLINLMLLDTDLSNNHPEDREITSKLYSGDTNMRIRQEIVLGIGGVKALKACGLNPTVFHLNEGHPAFVGFARIGQFLSEGVEQRRAVEIVRKSTLFTTHTPVPAGFDVFNADQMRKYLEPICRPYGLNLNQIMAIGKANPFDEKEPFSMALAAMRMSTYRNGVSDLHGDVSRKMFHYLWVQSLESHVPIGHVTNGIHLPSFINPEFKRVLYHYLSDNWYKKPQDLNLWEKVRDIPAGVLFDTKRRLREKLVNFARKRLKEQLLSKGGSTTELLEVEDVLRPDVLTIGFARRFATYKRAFLFFSDEERLRKILLNPERPVQIIIAGKAHPHDNEGKDFIRRIIQTARKPELRKNIVFIEDYDIEIARYITSGSDIWLNTPRRPMEASGTSGMKAACNATLNFSVLDGWWVEGFNGENGWSVGAGEDYMDHAYQDYVESHDLYNKLEQEIVPLFYTKARSGLPEGWVSMMKSTLTTLPPFFNSTRMLMEYTENYYMPLHNLRKSFEKDDNANQYFKWYDSIIAQWDSVTVSNAKVDAKTSTMGDQVTSSVHVNIGALRFEDVAVYTVIEYDGDSNTLKDPNFLPMKHGEKAADGSVTYQCDFTLSRAGRLKVTFAVVPAHPFVAHMFELNKVKWG